MQAKLLGPFRDLSSGLSHLGETGGWVRLRDERFGGAPKGGLGGGGEGWKLRPTSLPGAGSELSRNLHPGEGWMLLSGAKIGLGVLLAPVDDRAAREVRRYRVRCECERRLFTAGSCEQVRRYRVRATPHAAVCESPGGPPSGKRISPDLPRSPQISP